MGKTKRENKQKKKLLLKSGKTINKKSFGYKNELSFLVALLLALAESVSEVSTTLLSIDIKYFLYAIVFFNISRSVYKFCLYKKWVTKREDLDV